MKHVGIGLLLLWSLVVVGSVVTLLALDGGSEDQGRGPGAGPCTCETLGARARRCGTELLDRAAALVRDRLPRAERSSARGWAKVSAVRLMLGDAIDRGAVPDRCRKLRRTGSPLARAAWALVRRCWPERGCGAFARCLGRGAPRVIEQAGL